LAVHVSSIHLSSSRFSIFLALISDESKTLSCVVHISHGAKLLKLSLKVAVGEVLIDSVDKKLTALFSHCDGVWILRSGKTTGFSEKCYRQDTRIQWYPA